VETLDAYFYTNFVVILSMVDLRIVHDLGAGNRGPRFRLDLLEALNETTSLLECYCTL